MYVFFNIYDIIKFESLFYVFYFDFKIYVLGLFKYKYYLYF